MSARKYDLISVTIVALILSVTSFARAQIDIGNFTISGSAEVGAIPRSFSGHRAKFEEYRDLPDTAIVPELQLKIDSKKNDYYFDFDASKVGRDDQNFRLRVGRYGWLDMEFEWDQVPHFFNGNTAATPYRDKNGLFNLLSKPGVAGNCPSLGSTEDWVNNCSNQIDLGLIHGFARFKLNYTPRAEWKFTVAYSSQNSNGDRAFATVTNGFSNIIELAEPIDYQTHNIEVGGEYAGDWWTLALKYNASLFHNNTSTLVWDNPFNSTGLGAGGVGCTDSVGTTCQSRLDLYPSNHAHTVSLTGTAKMWAKTTFLGTVSYGTRLQDDKFLPFTINSALAPFNSIAALSRTSLDGDVRPFMLNATLVNRFIDRLDLRASYRLYDLDNRSKTLLLDQGYIRGDAGTATAAADQIRSVAYSYTKHNIGLDARYEFTRWLSGKLSYGWEKMNRDRREVLNSNEHSISPSFDIKPNSWLLLRASYRRSWRDADNYDAGRLTITETGLTPEQIREERLAALRKVDEAARHRDKISFFTQISPHETLTLHGGFDFIHDNFPDTTVGVKNDFNYSPSVGFVYAPMTWVSFFGDYNFDRFDWKMRAMERSGQLGATGCPARELQTPENCPTSLWTSRGRDKVHTFSLGSDMNLIKDKLGLRLQYGFSQGRSLVRASGNTTTGNQAATDSPPVTNTWHEFLARFDYALHKHVALRFGYYFNAYKSKDIGVDIMKLWMGDADSGATNSIFLGDKVKGDYEAHVGFFSVRLKF